MSGRTEEVAREEFFRAARKFADYVTVRTRIKDMHKENGDLAKEIAGHWEVMKELRYGPSGWLEELLTIGYSAEVVSDMKRALTGDWRE